MKTFTDQGVEVVGVSGDAVKTQDAFKKHNNLNFTLLSDEKGEVAKAFGVPTGKGGVAKVKVDGQDEQFTRAITIQRWTFVIDKTGKVAYKNPKVAAAEDSKAVKEAIEKLK
jgi:peroxiredoxin Q/BCP